MGLDLAEVVRNEELLKYFILSQTTHCNETCVENNIHTLHKDFRATRNGYFSG